MRQVNNNTTVYQIGILDVLQIVLIMLKAFNLIAWPWWKVFIPLMLEVAILGLVMLGMILARAIAKRKLEKKKNKED